MFNAGGGDPLDVCIILGIQEYVSKDQVLLVEFVSGRVLCDINTYSSLQAGTSRHELLPRKNTCSWAVRYSLDYPFSTTGHKLVVTVGFTMIFFVAGAGFSRAAHRPNSSFRNIDL